MVQYKDKNRDAYQNGYRMGYRAGYEDGISGKPKINMEAATAAYPVEMMGLSTRAYNCLYLSGCHSVGDVAQLKENKIRQIRNLGKITDAEIAYALERMGITGTDWEILNL